MGLLYDLSNLNVGKMTVEDIKKLNERGAYPLVLKGKIVRFEKEDGEILINV